MTALTQATMDVYAAYGKMALEIAIICLPYVIVCAFSACIREARKGKQATAEDVLLEVWRLPARMVKQAREVPSRFKALREARRNQTS